MAKPIAAKKGNDFRQIGKIREKSDAREGERERCADRLRKEASEKIKRR